MSNDKPNRPPTDQRDAKKMMSSPEWIRLAARTEQPPANPELAVALMKLFLAPDWFAAKPVIAQNQVLLENEAIAVLRATLLDAVLREDQRDMMILQDSIAVLEFAQHHGVDAML